MRFTFMKTYPMQRILAALLLFSTLNTNAQPVQRPKLVVGIVVDQMRWDFLYRYYERYEKNGGFRRMLSQGFSCENTMIPYAPTVTACGHSCIYSGTVPAISGITGNLWYDRELKRVIYCTEDKTVNTVGSTSNSGQQSPRNMLVTTICDELRYATNYKSKVIGLALKDRGSILPAGQSANAAYFYDGSSGKWISSTYYINELPAWVNTFNAGDRVNQYYDQGWNLLYPIATYTQSSIDDKIYESKVFGPAFPYDLKKYNGKDYSKILSTPFGNSLTTLFAKAAIEGEQLGADGITDFLAISYSSTDYIGHSFGPNSIEAEDGMVRLDKDLGDLLDWLDRKVGKGQYTVFLSSDHGVAPAPEFLRENKSSAGRFFASDLVTKLNKDLAAKYNINKIVVADENYQVHLDHYLLDSARINIKEVIQWVIDRLYLDPAIDRAFALEDLNTVPLPATIRKMINNGYYPRRNGDVQFILKPGYIDAWATTGTTHGLWNPYDAHIPLLWYGWGIKQGKSNKEVYMTDIAPTLAALLHIQMPSGCVGSPIEEVLR
jgi:predicted AlkP superfamily pyrophosphatase or phosphodiesterase